MTFRISLWSVATTTRVSLFVVVSLLLYPALAKQDDRNQTI
jgi:hypothetical protein